MQLQLLLRKSASSLLARAAELRLEVKRTHRALHPTFTLPYSCRTPLPLESLLFGRVVCENNVFTTHPSTFLSARRGGVFSTYPAVFSFSAAVFRLVGVNPPAGFISALFPPICRFCRLALLSCLLASRVISDLLLECPDALVDLGIDYFGNFATALVPGCWMSLLTLAALIDRLGVRVRGVGALSLEGMLLSLLASLTSSY